MQINFQGSLLSQAIFIQMNLKFLYRLKTIRMSHMGSIKSIQFQGLSFWSVTSISPDLQGVLCCSQVSSTSRWWVIPTRTWNCQPPPKDFILKQMTSFCYGHFLTMLLLKFYVGCNKWSCIQPWSCSHCSKQYIVITSWKMSVFL